MQYKRPHPPHCSEHSGKVKEPEHVLEEQTKRSNQHWVVAEWISEDVVCGTPVIRRVYANDVGRFTLIAR